MRTLWGNLMFALYCASIIIGAGVLTMPLTGRLLGFVPLIAVTFLMGLVLILIYRRMAHTLFTNVTAAARDWTDRVRDAMAWGMDIQTRESAWTTHMRERVIITEVQKGAALFDDVVRRTGIGSAGHVTLLVGMFFYVFFADIGYIIIGNRSLNALGQLLRERGDLAPYGFTALGIALIIGCVALPRLIGRPTARRGALQKFLMMAGWWLVAIAILAMLGDSALRLGSAGLDSILGSLLFLVSILSAMFTATDGPAKEHDRDGLNAQHRVNVIVTIVELLLLAVTGLLIMIIFAGNHILEQPCAFAPDWFSRSRLPDWSRVIGVVLFAYVGTGIFNLCSYRQLFEGNPSTDEKPRFGYVVALGTLVPMLLYVGWTCIGGFALSPQELAAADANNAPTHIAIASKAASVSPEGALVITLTGYLFALMAVTSACSGFTESLADRIGIALRHSRRRYQSTLDLRPFILVSAATVALARDVFSASVDITAILSVAGTAGGGLLILVLPFFFPYPLNRRRRARYWEIAVVLVIAAFLVVGIVSEPTESLGAVGKALTGIKLVVATVVAIMTAWLLFSEPPE